MGKHPNENWLRYMLAVSGSDQKQLAEVCQLYGFPTPAKAYVASLVKTLNSTKPTPFDTANSRCKTWLRRQRIMSIASEEPDVMLARDCLGDWRVRAVIETLLIANVVTEEVQNYCLVICGKKLTKRVIEFYRHYFWNTQLMSPKDWYAYLDLLDPPDRDRLASSRTHGGEYALWRLGYRAAMDKGDIVNMVLHEATMRFMETSAMPNNKDTATTAKTWSDQVFRAIEEQEKAGEVQHALKELKHIAIRLAREDIKGIEELKASKHE
jgi:hypothetical protein